MRFFRKYDLVLPPAALLYGIFAWNMKYPGDGLPQTMMDNLVNGWLLITVLFAALSAGIVYQLQQNKKQQYNLQPSMDKERHLPKESYKTAYITFVRGDHLWNFLCNEDRNDSECGINHECDHMHIMECSNVFCILCTDTGFIDRDSIYLARTCHSSRYILCDIADDPSESGIFTPVAV